MGLRLSYSSAPNTSSLNGPHRSGKSTTFPHPFYIHRKTRHGSVPFSSNSHFPMTLSIPLFSGSAKTNSKNRFSVTTSSTAKSQFTEIVGGSFDGEGFLPLPLPLPLPCPDDRILKWPDLKVFSFKELKSATKNFKADTYVGEGGFGKVYKGRLHEKIVTLADPGTGMLVAVKILNPESMQGFHQWQSELNLLGRLSHPNLVNLLGYCWDEDKLLLVYEFMPKGSLDNHLFRRNPNIEPLSWNTRLKIAIGAAHGLGFLHTSENRVIHRDLKTTNILLNGNYNAKISDFGLARLDPSEGQSHVSTRIIGTLGYVAPEYITTGHLYVKSDVYGFGVVLLEILTGLRVLDRNRQTGLEHLVEWTKPFLCSKKRFTTIMDARIDGQYSPEAAWQAAQLTLKCLKLDPEQRPSMKDVLEALEAIKAIQNRQFSAHFPSPLSAEL